MISDCINHKSRMCINELWDLYKKTEKLISVKFSLGCNIKSGQICGEKLSEGTLYFLK